TTPASMRRVSGGGGQKQREFGERFATGVGEFCRARGVATDQTGGARPARPAKAKPLSENKKKAAELFAVGSSVDHVATMLGLARATVSDYLIEYVDREKPADVSAWIDDKTYAAVVDAAGKTGADKLKPVFE